MLIMTLVDSLSHQVPSQTNLSQVHGVSPSGAPRGDRFVTLSAGARAIAAPAVATLARLDMAIAAVCAALVRPLQRSDLGVHISSRSDPALACFSADGGAYNAHYDGAADSRCKLTVILYLNQGWTKEDGGELNTPPKPPSNPPLTPL